MNESTVENFDKMHIVDDMYNGRVLDFQGLNRVTYLYVASGGDCFIVRICIFGGQNSRIESA